MEQQVYFGGLVWAFGVLMMLCGGLITVLGLLIELLQRALGY